MQMRLFRRLETLTNVSNSGSREQRLIRKGIKITKNFLMPTMSRWGDVVSARARARRDIKNYATQVERGQSGEGVAGWDWKQCDTS